MSFTINHIFVAGAGRLIVIAIDDVVTKYVLPETPVCGVAVTETGCMKAGADATFAAIATRYGVRPVAQFG